MRTIVEQAEGAAADEDYSTAAQHLAVAFEMARREFRAEMRHGRYVPHVTPDHVAAAVADVKKGDDDKTAGVGCRRLDQFLRGLAHRLESVSDQVEALSLGARASDYAWFKNNFPEVHQVIRLGEAHLGAYEPVEPVTRNVYLHGLDFVTTTALHWQEFPAADSEGLRDDFADNL